jgi:lysophospholipase L1-like esterase
MQGAFLEKRPLSLSAGPPGWNKYEVIQKDGTLSLLINGERVFQTSFKSSPLQQFGFRNGENQVLLADVSVFGANGTELASENFRNTRYYVLVLLAAVALVYLLNSWIGREQKKNNKRWTLYALTCNLVLIAVFGLYFAADWFYFSAISLNPQEPFLDAIHLPSFMSAASAEVNTRRQYIDKHPGIYRVIFLGSSQTFGEGANTENDRWMNRIQQSFDARDKGRTEVLRAGMPGSRADPIFRKYREYWLEKGPNLAVIDLSNNDDDPAKFRKSLEDFVRLDCENGIKTLFILEPNDPEAIKNLAHTAINHQNMREVAARMNVPVVEMHQYLSSAEVYDSGFLWWDFVHLTSYGQKLFADHLFPTLEKIIRHAK